MQKIKNNVSIGYNKRYKNCWIYWRITWLQCPHRSKKYIILKKKKKLMRKLRKAREQTPFELPKLTLLEFRITGKARFLMPSRRVPLPGFSGALLSSARTSIWLITVGDQWIPPVFYTRSPAHHHSCKTPLTITATHPASFYFEPASKGPWRG